MYAAKSFKVKDVNADNKLIYEFNTSSYNALGN
jgi:hypothetical protein